MAGKSSVHNKKRPRDLIPVSFNEFTTNPVRTKMLPSLFPDFINTYWSLYDSDD